MLATDLMHGRDQILCNVSSYHMESVVLPLQGTGFDAPIGRVPVQFNRDKNKNFSQGTGLSVPRSCIMYSTETRVPRLWTVAIASQHCTNSRIQVKRCCISSLLSLIP